MLGYLTAFDLQSLADNLISLMHESPKSNPLSPEIVVVQNHGMARWLSLYLAENEGIAANLQFEFPAERIWALIREMEADIPKSLPTDRIPMAWSILQLLRNHQDARLSILHQYAHHENPKQREMRRWKLSGRIADVFDQYLTYRPDMILEWENERFQVGRAPEPWQPVLWNALVTHWNKNGNSDFFHPARLQQKLIKAIDKGEITEKVLPERITVFGVSTMPPSYLKIFVKLSKLTDVHFMLVGPRNKTENSLSVSLGKTGFEYRELLEDFIAREEISPQSEELTKRYRKRPNSLLEHLQADLLGQQAKDGKAAWDGSIQFHSCHSPRREVEVLYDQLLAMFDADEELDPDEVMVLTPDLDSYAPEIEAVFGTVEEGLPRIPFHLADRQSNRANPVFNTVSKLLSLVEGRFKVTELLDLLDSEPVQLKYKFSDDSLTKLERWIDENNIRWGIDEEFKASLDLPDTKSYTWKAGLERIMLGYAMKPEDDRLFEGIYPYSEVEQSEDTQLAGRLVRLMESLFRFRQNVNESKTLDQWSEALQKLLTVFLPQQEYVREIEQVRDMIARLESHKKLSGLKGEISYGIIRDYLQGELEQDRMRGGRAGRGVTFGSLIQMRNIPARVICVLGLNDGSFPRHKTPAAFDLMNRNPEKGDRSHSNEDRQRFLETLLAAKEHLYLSYVGQSNRQDSKYPPSVVLRELKAYLKERFGVEEQELLTHHPLQSFSPKYFKQDDETSMLFSYSAKNRDIAEKLLIQDREELPFLEGELPDPDADYKKLSLNELISFFHHPAKYLLQNRFGIYLNQERILDEDREPFQLDNLRGYQLGQELLDRVLTDESKVSSYRDIAEATDMLPEGWPGDQAFSQKAAEARDFGKQLQDFLEQERLDVQEIDLKIDDFRITGRLNQVFSEEQLFYRFGRARPKDFIELWLKHLIFQLVKPKSHTGRSSILSRGKKQPIEVHEMLPVSKAENKLHELLGFYWKGLKVKSFFFPESSFAFAEAFYLDQKEAEDAVKATRGKWKNNYTDFPMEGDDPYNRLLTSEENPLEDPRFQEESLFFWEPFFEHLNQGAENK